MAPPNSAGGGACSEKEGGINDDDDNNDDDDDDGDDEDDDELDEGSPLSVAAADVAWRHTGHTPVVFKARSHALADAFTYAHSTESGVM
jgi:hypothetical protein